MKNTFQIGILVVCAAAFLMAGLNLSFGAPAYTDMDDYMLAHGQEETGSNNIVTGVVFDYRGFDTLGEATVLFTVVLGAGLVFRRLGKKEDEYEYE
ncbi:hydrogen gas-evolving membrane-bound hydrogenase subunit E [Methanogenium cariaci]|jgi:multisubunit Na+/H+ antiporter MnhB subunit